MSKSKTKTVLIGLYNIKGTIPYELTPPKQATYFQVLDRLRKPFVEKDQIIGRTSEFCIMTMRLPIQQFQ
jgi:hypothetical protein